MGVVGVHRSARAPIAGDHLVNPAVSRELEPNGLVNRRGCTPSFNVKPKVHEVRSELGLSCGIHIGKSAELGSGTDFSRHQVGDVDGVDTEVVCGLGKCWGRKQKQDRREQVKVFHKDKLFDEGKVPFGLRLAPKSREGCEHAHEGK